MVWPVIAYGAAVWGDRFYSCIEAIQNRAMRIFLSVGRYTPIAGVGDKAMEICLQRAVKILHVAKRTPQ